MCGQNRELDGLSDLLNVKVECARVHAGKRKRLFDHKSCRNRNRLTVYFNQKYETSYVDEKCSRNPKKLPHEWKGVTIFYVDRPKPTDLEDYYIDTPEGLIHVPMTYEEALNVKAVFATWNALPGELGEYKTHPHETFLLQSMRLTRKSGDNGLEKGLLTQIR